REMGRDAVRVRRAQGGRRGVGIRPHPVLPRAPRPVQGAARGGVRRAAQDLHRQDPEVPAARKGEVGRRDRYMSAVPKSQDILLREESAGICTLTMKRPQQMNLLTSEMLAALQSSFNELSSDNSIRVVILAAAGKGFC